jgi:hypothetical protein
VLDVDLNIDLVSGARETPAGPVSVLWLVGVVGFEPSIAVYSAILSVTKLSVNPSVTSATNVGIILA